MKTALSMVALVVLLASGCESSSVAEQAKVTTSAKPTTRLYVHTKPAGAEISVDGNRKGKSPQLIPVPPGAGRMIVEMELEGHEKGKREVVIEGGRIIRVEFTFTKKARPPAESATVPPPPRILLYLVVGKDRMTFQGKDITWDELPKALEKFPASKNTVLHIARAPGEMTAEHWDRAVGRAINLIKRFGFGNLSQIGVHPLGFVGAPSDSALPAPEDEKAAESDFGPVIERVVYDDRYGKEWLIDLDSGKVHKPPPEIDPEQNPKADGKKLMAWAKERGIDASGIKANQGELWCFDLQAVVLPAEAVKGLKASRADVLRALGQKTGPDEGPGVRLKELPDDAAYAFKTREGGMGVLQVLGPTADGQGVRIRYALLQNVTSESIWERMKNPPEGWKVELRLIVPDVQIMVIEMKLSGETRPGRQIKRASNTICSAHGQRVQVNVIECWTKADAENIHKGVLAMKGDPAYALRFDNTIVQFVGGFDVAFAKRAARELGLQPEPDGPKGASFGPVFERVINDHKVGKDYLIDLDTGKLYTRPANLDNLEEMHAWARKQGVDASGVLASEGVLGGFEIGAAIVDDASWEGVTPQAVREALKQPDPRLAVRQEDAPTMIRLGGKGVSPERVYAFETREGGVGVLQLLGPGDKDRRSVKIRYKLVSGTSVSPAADRVWTCPMHPQVNVPKPGKCPTCAMDLIARPPRSAAEQAVREVISNFVEAATRGDRASVAGYRASVAKFLSKRSHQVLEHTREIMSEGIKVAEISFVVVAHGRALAVTDFAQVPDPESKKVMCVVYIMVKQGDRWVIEDIDLATANGLSDHIGDLQAEPDQDESTQPSKKVHLPDADTRGAATVLDLASGEVFPFPGIGGPPDLMVFTRLGKGDLFFDRVLGCPRGAKAMQWDGKRFVTFPPKEQIQDASAYELLALPCRLLITTAEKKHFDVKILALTEDGGIDLEYRPADPAVVPKGSDRDVTTPAEPDPSAE